MGTKDEVDRDLVYLDDNKSAQRRRSWRLEDQDEDQDYDDMYFRYYKYLEKEGGCSSGITLVWIVTKTTTTINQLNDREWL